MRVECEPSRSVSKKASGRSSRARIQRSLELFARSKCSQRNSFAVSARIDGRAGFVGDEAKAADEAGEVGAVLRCLDRGGFHAGLELSMMPWFGAPSEP
jgi:hypothetical protein